MNLFGHISVVLLVPVCLGGFALAVSAAISRRQALVRAAVWACYASLVLAALASIALLTALLTRDFSNQYVYEHTSRALSIAYTVSAFWAGNAGSLLLWALLLAVFSVIAVRACRREDPASLPHVTSILLAISSFFSLILVFTSASNPFVTTAGAPPADGYGLNPMLQNLGMVIHPVALYVGYVGLAIPFALVMGGLMAGRGSLAWGRSARRWTLVAWLFLTVGNIVGAWWAYVTLGWGGYWAWDPVENASLMPWLTSTALVHSLVMIRKRDMLKIWTVFLVAFSFILTIFGTFLTRSGIATSVHAFGDNSFIPWFTVFIGLMVLFSLYVILTRLPILRSTKRLDHVLSRESSFVYNNIVLMALTIAVLWGVLFPTIAGAIKGQKVELGTGYYPSVTVPLGLILMLLAGLCTLLLWRGVSWSRLARAVGGTFGFAVVVLIVLVVLGVRRPYPLISFTLAAFTVASVALQYWRGWRERRAARRADPFTTFGQMIWSNRPRYGGFLVHFGIILLLVGVTGSYAFKVSAEGDVSKGGSLTVGSYELVYDGLTTTQVPDKQVARATFTLERSGKVVGILQPVKEYYPASDQTWTKVARRSTLAGDVYVTLLGYSEDESSVSIQAQINPLVNWLWIGGAVMVLGGIIAIWPKRSRRGDPKQPEAGLTGAEGSGKARQPQNRRKGSAGQAPRHRANAR